MAYCQYDDNENNVESTVPRPGRVGEERQRWAVKEDGCLAYNLQAKEFTAHYGRNRETRRTVRSDIPVAKLVQNEEEERKQRERMELLEKNKQIADRDAVLAKQLSSNDSMRHQGEQNRIVQDSLYAECLQSAEMQQAYNERRQIEDEITAQNILCAELLHDNQRRKQTELDDAQLALELQQKEQQKYEKKLQERHLAKERKRLEATQKERSLAAGVMVAGYRKENLGGVQKGVANMKVDDGATDRMVRSDGKVEDLGDFSDFYIKPAHDMLTHEKKQLQELQDEELARLVQDQEHKRGAKLDSKKLEEIEKVDGEIARIMQEQEKLKAKKRGRRTRSKEEERPAQENHWERRGEAVDDNTLNERGPRSGRMGPPAYPDPPAYYQQRPLPDTPKHRHPSDSGSASPTEAWVEGPEDVRVGQSNVITSIDPTYQPQHTENTTDRARGAPHAGAHNPADMYSDMDDMQNAGPVQGQRRSVSKRDGKKASGKKSGCSQQ